MTTFAAQPGWRAFLCVREQDGPWAFPVIAWKEHQYEKSSYSPEDTLDAYVQIEPGVIRRVWQLNEKSYLLVGYLEPQEDLDQSWYERADEEMKAFWKDDD